MIHTLLLSLKNVMNGCNTCDTRIDMNEKYKPNFFEVYSIRDEVECVQKFLICKPSHTLSERERDQIIRSTFDLYRHHRERNIKPFFTSISIPYTTHLLYRFLALTWIGVKSRKSVKNQVVKEVGMKRIGKDEKRSREGNKTKCKVEKLW